MPNEVDDDDNDDDNDDDDYDHHHQLPEVCIGPRSRQWPGLKETPLE